MNSRTRLRWLHRGSLLIGVVLLALWSGAWLESYAFQASESKKLEAARIERAFAPSAADVNVHAAFIGPPEAGAKLRTRERTDALGRIEIPRLGITAIVAQGVDDKTLKRAVGHVAWTALPGRPGNCALAGHRDTFFRGLGDVRKYDWIRIVTPERTLTYQVAWTEVVDPSRVDLLDSTDTRALTIVTCYPFKFVGRAPKRFVVRALQVESIAARSNQSSDLEPGSRDGRGSLK